MDPKPLKFWTGLSPEEIELLLSRFVEEIECADKTPLFRNCVSTTPDRATGATGVHARPAAGAGRPDPSRFAAQARLEYMHALQLSLVRHMATMTQGQLAYTIGVGQSTVCRYLKMNE